MQLSFFGLRTSRRAKSSKSAQRRPTSSLRFRPTVESLEGRLVLSTATLPVPNLAPAITAGLHQSHQLSVINLLPLTINNIVVQDGQLVANGSLGATTFQLPLTLSASPNSADPSCRF